MLDYGRICLMCSKQFDFRVGEEPKVSLHLHFGIENLMLHGFKCK